MNLIELHILQSFPVTCLNRDDVGSPKSATFGGSQRARVSSQALKRASRLRARDESPVGFEGIRSRFLVEPFTATLIGAGLDEEDAAKKAVEICEAFSTIDKKNPDQVTTAVFLSPSEIQQVAAAVVVHAAIGLHDGLLDGGSLENLACEATGAAEMSEKAKTQNHRLLCKLIPSK